MKFAKVLSVMMITVALSGCAQLNKDYQFHRTGTGIGAIAGTVVGAHFGSGGGHVIGGLVGLGVGAILGDMVGKMMDE